MFLQVQISYLRGHVPTSKLHLRRLNNNGGNQSGTATGTATSIASEGYRKFLEDKHGKYKIGEIFGFEFFTRFDPREPNKHRAKVAVERRAKWWLDSVKGRREEGLKSISRNYFSDFFKLKSRFISLTKWHIDRVKEEKGRKKRLKTISETWNLRIFRSRFVWCEDKPSYSLWYREEK